MNCAYSAVHQHFSRFRKGMKEARNVRPRPLFRKTGHLNVSICNIAKPQSSPVQTNKILQVMKNLLTTLALSLLGTCMLQAQGDAISRFFSDYEGRENVTNIQISGSMFRMLASASDASDTEDDFARIASDIESVHIIVDSEHQNALATMNETHKKLSGAYEGIMSVKEKDTRVEMYIAEKGGNVTELVLAVGETNNFIVMSVRGLLKMDDLNKIVNSAAASVTGDVFDGKKVDRADFKVWPNPASRGEVCKIAVPNDMLGSQLSIIDANGKQVSAETVNQIEKTLNLSQMGAGTYVLKLIKDDTVVTKKLIVN